MKTYVLTGAGSRGLGMYAEPITRQFQATARLAGIYDINPLRARYVSGRCNDAPVFDDFDAMLARTRPDVVIVTSVDGFHHEYITRALEAGCDVITEKPMTIGAAQCRAILEAERRTGKLVTVTFNLRCMPFPSRIKALLQSGMIGKVLGVDFEWALDTRHGADYFRRWHSRMASSGGLLVHKATHHFDMINWWIEDQPKTVFGFGDLKFYGPTRPERAENCRNCGYTHTCEFYWDATTDPEIKALYLDCEQADGYLRDACVFRPAIDIYDTMSVTVAYRGGPLMSYSLVAHSPYEGWRVAISGTDGRLEAQEIQSGTQAASPTLQCQVFDRQGSRMVVEVPKASGMHGGGDRLLLQRLFGAHPVPDPLGQMADSWAGAMSILIGVAANQSIQTGRPVEIEELLKT
jgi:predicted dehydrogenase